MADNASGNSRSKRRRRANRKRSKKTKTCPDNSTEDIKDEKCESDADDAETQVKEEITTIVNKHVEISENYRVESPKPITTKPNIGSVVKSRSLDDEEMLKITEISESECDEKSECNNAIIAEADSDVEWESTENLTLKPPSFSLNLQQPSLDLQLPTIQQPIPISPEEEKNLRDFLQTINLVTSPQKSSHSTTNKAEAIKAKRRRKREQLAQYFMPVYHNPRFLDAISEESDLSDREYIAIEKHGVQIVHTPIVQQDVCYTKNVQTSLRAEIVILEDTTSSSNEGSQSDEAEDGAETDEKIDGFDLTPPPTPENEKERNLQETPCAKMDEQNFQTDLQIQKETSILSDSSKTSKSLETNITCDIQEVAIGYKNTQKSTSAAEASNSLTQILTTVLGNHHTEEISIETGALLPTEIARLHTKTSAAKIENPQQIVSESNKKEKSATENIQIISSKSVKEEDSKVIATKKENLSSDKVMVENSESTAPKNGDLASENVKKEESKATVLKKEDSTTDNKLQEAEEITATNKNLQEPRSAIIKANMQESTSKIQHGNIEESTSLILQEKLQGIDSKMLQDIMIDQPESSILQENIKQSAALIPQENTKKSAAAIPQENIKQSAAPILQEIIKNSAAPIPQENIKQSAAPILPENIKQSAAAILQENVKQSAAPIPQENIKPSAPPIPQENLEESKYKTLPESAITTLQTEIIEEVATTSLIEDLIEEKSVIVIKDGKKHKQGNAATIQFDDSKSNENNNVQSDKTKNLQNEKVNENTKLQNNEIKLQSDDLKNKESNDLQIDNIKESEKLQSDAINENQNLQSKDLISLQSDESKDVKLTSDENKKDINLQRDKNHENLNQGMKNLNSANEQNRQENPSKMDIEINHTMEAALQNKPNSEPICDFSNLHQSDVKSSDSNLLGELNQINIVSNVIKTSVNTISPSGENPQSGNNITLVNRVFKNPKLEKLNSKDTQLDNLGIENSDPTQLKIEETKIQEMKGKNSFVTKNISETKTDVILTVKEESSSNQEGTQSNLETSKQESAKNEETIQANQSQTLKLSDDELLLEKIRKKNMDFKKAADEQKCKEVIIIAEKSKKSDANKTKRQNVQVLSDSLKKYFGLASKNDENVQNTDDENGKAKENENVDELFKEISKNTKGNVNEEKTNISSKEGSVIIEGEIEAISKLSELLEKRINEGNINTSSRQEEQSKTLLNNCEEIFDKEKDISLNDKTTKTLPHIDNQEESKNPSMNLEETQHTTTLSIDVDSKTKDLVPVENPTKDLSPFENLAKDSFPPFGIVRDFVINSSEETKEQSHSNVKFNVRKIYGQEAIAPSTISVDNLNTISFDTKPSITPEGNLDRKVKFEVRKVYGKNQSGKTATETKFTKHDNIKTLDLNTSINEFSKKANSNTIGETTLAKDEDKIRTSHIHTLKKLISLKDEEETKTSSNQTIAKISLTKDKDETKTSSTEVLIPITVEDINERFENKSTGAIKKQPKQTKIKDFAKVKEKQREYILDVKLDDSPSIKFDTKTYPLENDMTERIEEHKERIIPVSIESQAKIPTKINEYIIPMSIEDLSKNATKINEHIQHIAIKDKTKDITKMIEINKERVIPINIEDQSKCVEEIMKHEEQSKCVEEIINHEKQSKCVEQIMNEEEQSKCPKEIMKHEEQSKCVEEIIKQEEQSKYAEEIMKHEEHVIPICAEDQNKNVEHKEHVVPVRIEEEIEIIPINLIASPKERFIPINIEDSEMIKLNNKACQKEHIIDVQTEEDSTELGSTQFSLNAKKNTNSKTEITKKKNEAFKERIIEVKVEGAQKNNNVQKFNENKFPKERIIPIKIENGNKTSNSLRKNLSTSKSVSEYSKSMQQMSTNKKNVSFVENSTKKEVRQVGNSSAVIKEPIFVESVLKSKDETNLSEKVLKSGKENVRIIPVFKEGTNVVLSKGESCNSKSEGCKNITEESIFKENIIQQESKKLSSEIVSKTSKSELLQQQSGDYSKNEHIIEVKLEDDLKEPKLSKKLEGYFFGEELPNTARMKRNDKSNTVQETNVRIAKTNSNETHQKERIISVKKEEMKQTPNAKAQSNKDKNETVSNNIQSSEDKTNKEHIKKTKLENGNVNSEKNVKANEERKSKGYFKSVSNSSQENKLIQSENKVEKIKSSKCFSKSNQLSKHEEVSKSVNSKNVKSSEDTKCKERTIPVMLENGKSNGELPTKPSKHVSSFQRNSKIASTQNFKSMKNVTQMKKMEEIKQISSSEISGAQNNQSSGIQNNKFEMKQEEIKDIKSNTSEEYLHSKTEETLKSQEEIQIKQENSKKEETTKHCVNGEERKEHVIKIKLEENENIIEPCDDKISKEHIIPIKLENGKKENTKNSKSGGNKIGKEHLIKIKLEGCDKGLKLKEDKTSKEHFIQVKLEDNKNKSTQNLNSNEEELNKERVFEVKLDDSNDENLRATKKFEENKIEINEKISTQESVVKITKEEGFKTSSHEKVTFGRTGTFNEDANFGKGMTLNKDVKFREELPTGKTEEDESIMDKEKKTKAREKIGKVVLKRLQSENEEDLKNDLVESKNGNVPTDGVNEVGIKANEGTKKKDCVSENEVKSMQEVKDSTEQCKNKHDESFLEEQFDQSFEKVFKEVLEEQEKVRQSFTAEEYSDKNVVEEEDKAKIPAVTRESSASSDTSVGTTQCTVKSNPMLSSIGDVNSIIRESEIFDDDEDKINPESLKEICVTKLLSLPFGADILEELAEVSKSLEEFTNQLPKRQFHIPNDGKIEFHTQKVSNSSFTIPADKWVGLATEGDPRTVICLSPTQKEFLEGQRRRPQEADRLLEMHEKFLNRRSYHENFTALPKDEVDGVRLLGGIKEEEIDDDDNESRKEDEKGLKKKDEDCENGSFTKDEGYNENIQGFLELHEKFLKQRSDFNDSKEAFLSNNLKDIKEEIEDHKLLQPTEDENRLLKFLRSNSENPGCSSSNPDDAKRRNSEDLELKRWSSMTLPSEARLKARGLSEWLQLARGGANLANCKNKKSCSTNNLAEKRAPLLPPRRRSLPHELYVKQMQYLIQKEKEIQEELESLEKEKRDLNSQMHQVQTQRQFQPEDYRISKNGDVAELDESKRSAVCEGNEKFRQVMYQEYMEKVAAREERKHKKVIKISMNEDEVETKKPIDNLEFEFMDKVKKRMEKQGLQREDTQESENEDIKEKVLIINGAEIKEAKKLPKHLKEFVDIAQQNEHESAEFVKRIEIEKRRFGDFAHQNENEGIWSPGQRQDFNPEERKREAKRDTNKEPIPPIWTPRSAGSSPTAERKEFRPVNFESPVLGRKTRTKSDGSATLTLTQPPWKNTQGGDEPPVIEKRLPTSFSAPGPGFADTSRLPRAQNPTITLLQKAREGQIPKSAAYIEQERARRKNESPYSSSDIIYQVRTESISDSDSERPRKITVSPRKFEGVGPTTKDGMPITLRSEVRDGNMSQWYKKMYETIHKQKPKDEYVMVRYKQRRARYPYTTGYLSEPEPGAYDSDATLSDNKFSTLDRRRPVSNKENDYSMSSTLPRSAISTSTISYRPDVQHTTEVYKNQPGRIENYTPGQSSISDKEAKKHLEQQKRVPQTKGYMSQALKESGYESDSTLVFRRRDDTAQQLSPLEQKEVYKNIQKGGDVPLHGLRKPAPERPKESPRKYVENEVTIHYRTPVRREVKEVLSEDELSKRQADAMRKIYEEERRRKYLQVSHSDNELHDMNSRRHTDNFIPSQKSPIPLNRYDDFLDDLSPRVKPRPRSPEPRLVARALYNFVGQTSRELTFKKGDIIYIRRQVDKNWYEGEINAMIGLFPANYVEIIPYDGIKTTPRKPHEGQARAKYNFIAQTHLELSLAKGELVVVTRRVDDNWFEGKIGGRKGIFPVSYVEILIDPGEAPPAPTKPVASPAAHSMLLNGSAGGKESMGSHNYVPTFPTQDLGMSYRAKPVQITGGGSNYGSLKKSPMDQALHIETQSEPVPYRALYKYLPQNEDELELLEGDTVYVLEKCDDGWYVGSSERTGAFGTFPGNYVKRI